MIGTAIYVLGNLVWGDGFMYNSVKDFLIEFGFYQLYSFVLGFSNMYYFNYLNSRNWGEGKLMNRILAGVFGSIAITVIGLFALRMFTQVAYVGHSVSHFLENESWQHYSYGIWITLTIVVIFHFIYFYNRYQQKKVKESQLVAKTETAKFESLKNQLDPHFLFNSLNVLTSLIEENPRQAEMFTTKLSKVYRYVLEQKDKDLIPVEEELKFAKSYMELLKTRFEDGISFSIPESVSNPELKIVPLSLQLLLENAVKHNTISPKNPLIVEIYEEEGVLVVKNNSNPKTSVEKGTKVGLRNISQRYSLVSKAKIEIIKTNEVFSVKLPLLIQKIKIMKTDYMNDSSKYIRAKKHVDELKGFYGGTMAYCIVIPFLIYINIQTSPGFHWFWFPLFGWGLGMVIHAFQVFGYGANWEERKIREIMNKDKF